MINKVNQTTKKIKNFERMTKNEKNKKIERK